MKKSLVLFLMLMPVFFASAQKSPAKFGKIEIEAFASKFCPIDSDAHAYFLFDYGHSYFEYDESKGFQLYFNRHFRIHILDQTAADEWGNFSIPLYKSEAGREEVTWVNAATLNFEEGDISKSVLARKDMIEEKVDENHLSLKLALPNVKAGSIIEIVYTVRSDFFGNIQDWSFQHTIPVLKSEYHIYIPEYYQYNQTMKGYYTVSREDKSQQNTSYKYKEYIYDYQALNIPAFPSEGYLSSITNYLTRIELELTRIHYPQQAPVIFSSTWSNVKSKLMTYEGFGDQLKTGGKYLDSEVAQIQALGLNGVDLAAVALAHMKQKMLWNENASIYVSNSLKTTYENGAGNCADINMNLVLLLRELGLQAYPLVLSTRNNGFLFPYHPSITQFNYVIAVAMIDGHNYLLDATDPYSEIDLLPIRCINEKGLLMDESPEDIWVELKPGNYIEQNYYTLALNEQGVFTGQTSSTLSGYAAHSARTKIKKHTDISAYVESRKKEVPELNILNFQITGVDTLGKKVVLKSNIEIHNKTTFAGDLLYFKPMLIEALDAPPFKLNKREYPVEFEYTRTVVNTLDIAIPSDYVVEELPKSVILKKSDGSIKYTFSCQTIDNRIITTSNFVLNKVQFLPEEYEELKSIFNLVVAKQNESIILKRKTE